MAAPVRPRLLSAMSERLCSQRCGAAPGAGAQPAPPGAAMLGARGALPLRVSLRDREKDRQASGPPGAGLAVRGKRLRAN